MLAIIQSRFNSSRLPGKALARLGERSVLGRTFDRLRRSLEIDSIIIATSNLESDRVITEYAMNLPAKVFRGSLEDVGKRLLQASLSENADAFVRISGDSPFIDWRIVDHAIKLYREAKPDLLTNIFHRTFPKGQSVEIIKTRKLAEICDTERTEYEKEHVTPYFYKHVDKFRILSFTSGRDSGGTSQCIDVETDLQRAEQMLIRHEVRDLSWQEIEALLETNDP